VTDPTPLRWASRMMQRSISTHVKTGLTNLGWFATPPGFADNPITWDDDHDTEGAVAGGVAPVGNTVGLSIGDVPDSAVEELGGGLLSIDYPVFFDIYGENRSTALNIADDIVGILQGELWSPSRYIPLYDQSQSPPTLLTQECCEARLVEARWNVGTQVEWRRRWRIVTFTATRYYIGSGE